MNVKSFFSNLFVLNYMYLTVWHYESILDNWSMWPLFLEITFIKENHINKSLIPMHQQRFSPALFCMLLSLETSPQNPDTWRHLTAYQMEPTVYFLVKSDHIFSRGQYKHRDGSINLYET